MKQNVFYLLLLITVFLIRFTFLFELSILSLVILLFLTSAEFDLKDSADQYQQRNLHVEGQNYYFPFIYWNF